MANKSSTTRKIQRHRQITIPKSMFEKMNLSEGDFVELVERKGSLVMIPQKLVDKNQAWFWTKEWQQKEQKAEQDIKEDRVHGPFRSTEEMKENFEDKKEDNE